MKAGLPKKCPECWNPAHPIHTCPVCWQIVHPTASGMTGAHWDSIGALCPGERIPYNHTILTSEQQTGLMTA